MSAPDATWQKVIRSFHRGNNYKSCDSYCGDTKHNAINNDASNEKERTRGSSPQQFNEVNDDLGGAISQTRVR
tara:strand:- start:7170 stop:7388 length:219 start_codon:yes stop_codon:yes gene_type:complete